MQRQYGVESIEKLNIANNSKFREFIQFINLEVARHGLGNLKWIQIKMRKVGFIFLKKISF